MAGRIGFAAESAELDAVARTDVDRLARVLKEQTERAPVSLSVMVLGVAGDPGGFCFNRSLSDKRAASVAEVLAGQGVKVQSCGGSAVSRRRRWPARKTRPATGGWRSG